MSTIVVRYTPDADRSDENQSLVEAVFAELHETQPDGLRYATLRLADGTFVHIAETDGENPLGATASFQAFTSKLGERCSEGNGPNPQPATVVGAYRLFAD